MPKKRPDELDDLTTEVFEQPQHKGPSFESPEWHDFVMGHFVPDELEGDLKLPNCDGLRRVAEKLLGPIMIDVVRTIQGPSKDNNGTAVVEAQIEFANGEIYSDVADVSEYNTPNPYCLHPTSTAATKAKSRALRKALRLRKIISAEEQVDLSDVKKKTEHPALEGTLGFTEDGISPAQVMSINMLCKKMNLNVVKLLNMGQLEYSSLSEITHKTAEDILQYLNTYKETPEEVSEEVKGYDPSWRENF